jgi:hypothetical protein
MLDNSLYGVSITGTLAIQDYASSFFSRSASASWTLLAPFAEDLPVHHPDLYPHPAQGGIYGIAIKDAKGKPCDVRAAVILTPDENGTILDQNIFYAANALLDCGWTQ